MASTGNSEPGFTPVRAQFQKVILLLLPALLLLAVVALVSLRFDIPVSRFTRDPLAITGGHPFLGVVSNLGAILWSSAAAVCLFTYTLLDKRSTRKDVRAFILAGGLFTLMLLFDDLFMLHEEIFPHYLGVNEKLVYAVYGALMLLYLAVFRKRIMETSFVFLVTALSLFALSIIADRLPDDVPPMHLLFEDGFKFLGIASWFGYHYSACRRYLAACSRGAFRTDPPSG